MADLRRRAHQILRPLILLGLSALLGCSASDIRIRPPNGGGQAVGTVVVTLTRQETGEPIDANAVVIVGGKRGEFVAGDTSVRIDGVPVPAGDNPVQPLTVTASGFVTSFQQLPLNASGQTSVTVELQEADLSATGTVEGRITNLDSGNPITSATVVFSPDIPDTTIQVKGATDEDGRYIIGGIPTGNTVANASANGFLSDERDILVIQDAGGGTNEDQDFELVSSSSTATVAGRVIDLLTRDPVEGATVEIGGQPEELTDATGRFEVTEVPVGDQVLTVNAEGYDPYSRTLTVLPGMADVQVELAPTEAGPPPIPATISGTVTILGRDDNSGATVEAVSLVSGATIDSTITDADGFYGLFAPPGEYRIDITFESVSISKTVTLLGAGRVLTGVDFQITAP